MTRLSVSQDEGSIGERVVRSSGGRDISFGSYEKERVRVRICIRSPYKGYTENEVRK